MIAAVLVFLVIGVIAVVFMAALEGRDAYIDYRSERLRIERSQRQAEQHLHQLSSEAFNSMLQEARRSSVPD